MKTVRHPSTEKLFRNAMTRWIALRKAHTRACDLMWAGTLASQFTKEEIALISPHLCPHDHELLAATKRSA